MDYHLQSIAQFMQTVTVPILYRRSDNGTSYSGSATLFELSGRHFIITARHLFDNFDPLSVAYPTHPNSAELRTIGVCRIVKPDTNKLDVAIVEILEDKTRKILTSGWKFLNLDNIAPATSAGAFALMGYPSESSYKNGEWLPGSGIVYFSDRICSPPPEAGDVDPATDLFFEFANRVFKNGTEEVHAPDLHGTSGAAIWELGADLDGGFWAPQKVLKVVAVQSAQMRGKYFRAVSWAVVASIFGQMDVDLQIAIRQILEPRQEVAAK